MSHAGGVSMNATRKQINWSTEEGDTCPRGNHSTQVAIYEHDGIEYRLAERCTYCQWQINFEPNPHKVVYGSDVDLPEDFGH